MRCQNCGENNANVSYTRIINGNKTELHLCSECAQKMNIGININFGFDDIFSRVGSLAIPEFTGFRSLEDEFENIFEDSFFPRMDFIPRINALEPSRDSVDEALDNIQKKYKKEEKKEVKKDKKLSEIDQLKEKLQEYIKKEEYEKAAVIRDKIKELEK